MAQPYVGEIRIFAGTFAPLGWEFCNGQLIAISENETLFQLIGTTYGGDGESTFALPNLQSRVPIHMGNSFILAETGGAEEITLITQQIPVHTHAMLATTETGTSLAPGNNLLAQTPAGVFLYREIGVGGNLAANAVTPIGGSQPHTNIQPYLALSFIISMFGIFPSPT